MDFGHFFHILFEILPIFFFAVITASLLDFYLNDNYFATLSSTPFPRFALVFLAAFLGALIPICTCGMIPLAMGLYKKKLDWRIILPFLLAGNACSFTALILNYQILGLEFTVARFFMAMAFAIILTYLFNAFAAEKIDLFLREHLDESHHHCCASHDDNPENHQMQTETSVRSSNAFFDHLIHDLKNSLMQFLPWIIFSAFIASLIHFKPESLSIFGDLIYDKYLAAPLFSIISFPFYFCAGTDIPLSKEFSDLRIPVSGILAFMTASPSINLTTLLVYKQSLGLKVALYITLTSILVISLLSLLFY